MSGLALMFDQARAVTAEDPAWVDFLESACRYKHLDRPDELPMGPQCVAAKLDSASSFHRGITRDVATGSWLIAAGTVLDPLNMDPVGDLGQLLLDYLDQGSGVFDRLDGQFALIVYDGQKDQVLVITDPFGLIFLYHGQRGHRWFISTSALAVAQAIRSQPSEFGVRRFILYGGNLGEMTLWQDVRRVMPATVLELTRGAVSAQPYWKFELDPTITQLPLKQSVDCVIDTLAGTLRRGLSREGKVWLSLTGGLDSRTLAALVDHSGLSFKSYCHGPPDSKDVDISAQISHEFGWDYEFFSLPDDWGKQRAHWLLCTVEHTDGHLDVLKRSRIIREQTLKARQHHVSLWGYGGETYRGFHWKQEFLRVGATSKVDYDRLLNYRILPAVDQPVLKDTDAWLRRIRDMSKAQLKAIGEQEPDWPNTVKLDLIGQFTEPALSGATISTVMGLQRVMSPFDFKCGMVCVISVNHKWRTHGRLFRLILERLNPPLAAFETADGGPASVMRLRNMHQFLPYWMGVGEKLAWAAGRRLLGKSPWRKTDPGTQGSGFPLAQWRRDTLSELADPTLLIVPKMHSAALYDAGRLQTFLSEAVQDSFGHEALLSRIMTVEMALRLVGASV